MKSGTEILSLKEFEDKWETELKRKNSNIIGTLPVNKREVEINLELNWQGDLYIINVDKVSAELLPFENQKREKYTKSQHKDALYAAAGICGLPQIKVPDFICSVEKLKRRDYLTLVPDTNILSKQILSRHLLKILGNGGRKRKVNWFQIIIPSCTLWELENNANRPELYSSKTGGKGPGFLGLQEIKNLKDRYPTFIVGDRPEILLNIPPSGTKNVRYDHLICRQLKDFMKEREQFENVYFLTMDKTLSSIAKIMDIKALYIPHPEEESEINSPFYSILQEGWTYTPITHFLWCLVYAFTVITIESKDNSEKIKIMADYPNKSPDEWLEGKILVEVM